MGWDKLTTFVDSYQTALEGLNKGDVSEVVESTYGYHIIKCTDYFHVDNQVDDINQVPKDIKKYVSNVVKTQAGQHRVQRVAGAVQEGCRHHRQPHAQRRTL